MPGFFDAPFLPITVASIYERHPQCGTEDSPVRENHELIYKISGQSEQRIGEWDFTFSEGMLLYIPKGYKNHAEITESGTAISIHFSLPAEIPEETLRPEVISCGLRYAGSMEQLAKVWRTRTAGAQYRCQAILFDFLADIAQKREKQYYSQTHYQKIEPAVTYIRENYLGTVRISDLTERCGISPQYLYQLFTHFFGQSPIDMVIELRLSYARELLADGSMTVEEAAGLCGFHYVGYFSRAYKKRYHISPGKRAGKDDGEK